MISSPSRSASGFDLTRPSAAELETLAAGLTPEERRVLLARGTERPFCGGLLGQKAPGVYHCRLCDLPLFRSAAKFESGTGWPSFTAPFDPAHVAELPDDSHGMVRTEIRCGRCDGHLGHVFDDGPRPTGDVSNPSRGRSGPTGRRYCLNSAALRFAAAG